MTGKRLSGLGGACSSLAEVQRRILQGGSELGACQTPSIRPAWVMPGVICLLWGTGGLWGGAACVPQGWTGFCSRLSACPLLTFTLLPPSCSVLQECQPLGSFVQRPLRVFLHLFALFPYPPPSPATNSFLSGLAEALCTQYPLNYMSYWHSPFPTVPTRISKCRPDEKWEQATEEGR